MENVGKEGLHEKVILKGIPASPGRFEGIVRVISSSATIEEMKEGEIFVTAWTNPEYVPAMLKASAIVTDLGGLLSHPAIVARELGIPAVVGTIQATKLLKDEMKVIVDGNEGTVLRA